MLWTRKTPPLHDKTRVVGIDLTSSRARAASVGGGKVRPVALDGPAEELLLFIACDRRTPEVGRAGYALARRMPHAVASNFLPLLGQPRDVKAGRFSFAPEAALEYAFLKMRNAVVAES